VKLNAWEHIRRKSREDNSLCWSRRRMGQVQSLGSSQSIIVIKSIGIECQGDKSGRNAPWRCRGGFKFFLSGQPIELSKSGTRWSIPSRIIIRALWFPARQVSSGDPYEAKWDQMVIITAQSHPCMRGPSYLSMNGWWCFWSAIGN
jgi:hypothetical protein